jgi:uncharacterized protein with ParB-like and HNH nuclease domain/predicted transport protein
MKATEAKLLEFLKKSPQFIIPIYQRTYSWTERECKQLWDDIIRTGTYDKISAHFIGSIVYIEKGLYQVSSQSPLLVIDGQQRLTTISLILEALARNLNGNEPVEGFSAKKIRHYYLLNPLEEGERAFKLLLTQTDKDSIIASMEQRDWPRDFSIRVKENFEYFENKIKSLGDDLEPLCKGLAKLMVVDISLSRDQDNPQLIFESMNSTGRELSQADLIRNYILMGLEPEQQTWLYEHHWRPMELAFGQEAYDKHFDGFMRHYLTFKTGDIPKISKVYEAFKDYANSPDIAAAGVECLVADINAFAEYYCAMALGQEVDPSLAMAFQDLRELKVFVSYPLLLELYHDYRFGTLVKDEFETILRLIEAYVFRRVVCNIPTNSLNKTFATFGRSLKKDRYLESVMAQFLTLPSYRRFPAEDEFKREIQMRDLYNLRTRSYFLRRMENHDRKERVLVDEYTIEHILPQNENLSQAWKNALGPEWKRIQDTWLHTLGNLTLTGYNSEYSDRPFKEKRDMGGGFKYSPLKLNVGLGEIEQWTEIEIEKRAKRLASVATKVWRSPQLSQDILNAYKEADKPSTSYAIEDQPYLSENSPMRPIFEAFRKEVLALDPAVSEEYLKLYVAYKAETNFVDVVPQASRLRLSLNMAFHEVHDPKGLCKDVTEVGRWGNGDVEVGLNSLDELPYVLGLVRQSLEKQLGDGEMEA